MFLLARFTRERNLSLHLCVPSTRLLAKRHGQHVVHVYTWLSEKRAKWRRKRETGMENGGEVQRENPLPQITRLGLLFIVGNFCSHREGASDRRSKNDLCAGHALESTTDQWGGTPRVDRPRIAIWVSSSRATAPLYYSFHSSFLPHPAKKRAQTRPFCGTEIIIITRIKEKRDRDSMLRYQE